MSYEAVVIEQDSEAVQAFLNLPKRLYNRKECVQNEREEREILTGTHLLSHYFSVTGLLVVDETCKVIGRVLLTIYPGQSEAYLGFFECENNPEAAGELLKKAEELAKEKGCQSIMGPVDASFWIRYRFKVSQFGRTYTGEPYNKDYYSKLWERNGYEVTQRYYSNHFMRVEAGFQDEKFAERLRQKLEEGYLIKSPAKEEFAQTLAEVYDLLIELYRDFPAYSYITKDEFCRQFDYLKYIIRYPIVKMAYYKGKAVGFFVSIPDYGNLLCGKLSVWDYVRLWCIRRHPRQYVMLYMGIDAAHRGLGKALTESVKEELQREGTPSVGALIKEENINRSYFAGLKDYEFEYVLMGKHFS